LKSLNEIIAELEAFATAHWQIHTFGHGDVWEISPQSDGIVYPILWMVPQTATPTLNEVVDEFTILCMDLVDSGERNETDVLSDTRQIILDVCAYYRQTHTNSYIIEFGGSIQPFTERDPERVSGHSLTVRIKQPHDYNLCAVPANAVPVPPVPYCADATWTLKDSLGNNLANGSIASGGNANITAPDATYTLINTALPPDTLDSGSIPSGDSDTIIAPPVTVLRDGQPFAVTPSGDTVDVPSDIPPCPNGSIGINGNAGLFTVASGGAVNILVEQDGGPIGAFDSDTNSWVIPNCPPPSQDWTRPTDWPAIPELTPSDERIVGVLAVFEHGYNVTTIAINNLAANINWGDGTSVVSNGATQTHVYDYTSIAATVYQFPDGRNVKYVLVDITRVGGAITSINFWNTSTVNARGGNNYLDIIASLPSVTLLIFSLSPVSGQKSMNLCQRIRVKAVGSGGNFSNSIRDTRSLRVLEWPYSTGGSFQNFSLGGGQIDDVGDVDLGTATAINGMFGGSMIRKHGNLTANSATTLLVGHASGCFLLTEFGNLTANSATALNVNFSGCVLLSKMGLVTATACQNLTDFALNCYSLPELIFSDCSAVTTTTNMVTNCVSLVNLVMPGLTRGVNLSTTAMGNMGMSNFANSLGTASGAQTVTVTGTPFGALLTAADATAVAIAAVITGKGFTVAN
jgi:hypothetical protein